MQERVKSSPKVSLAECLAQATAAEAGAILNLIEKPKNSSFGDLAIPCFEFAKRAGVKPNELATKLAQELNLPAEFSRAHAVGPFLNFFLNRQQVIGSMIAAVEQAIAHQTDASSRNATQKTIVEYSSPNIAKPFHVGHLRATIIGSSLDRLYRFAGHDVVSINHLGDWGTQFGFVWAGCKIWGRPENPTVYQLVELYKRATALKAKQELENPAPEDLAQPNINEMARAYFIDLEKGEQYAVDFWKWCLDISLIYFRETYKRLNISFDHYTGESFYSDLLDGVLEEFKKAGVLISSKNALGVELGEPLGFARIFTPDGRSLYLTRDIAAAEYRKRTFDFAKAVYVVGAPQTLHFQQLKAVLKCVGHQWSDDMVHVPFGQVLGMKTRGEGEVIELNELLDEAYERALAAYREQVAKRPEGLDETVVARGVALGALIFSTLNRSRMKDVQFSWQHALAFQGDSGPYVLYGYARINGIKERASEAGLKLRSFAKNEIDLSLLADDSSFLIVQQLLSFEDALNYALSDNDPSHLANYALDLAKTLAHAYLELKVIGVDPTLGEARLALFELSQQVLGRAIELLGMTVLERM